MTARIAIAVLCGLLALPVQALEPIQGPGTATPAPAEVRGTQTPEPRPRLRFKGRGPACMCVNGLSEADIEAGRDAVRAGPRAEP